MTDELAGRVSAIADDRHHGAAELARQSLQVLADVAEQGPAESADALRAELKRVAATLIASRPSMTSVTRLVTEWLHCCNEERPLDDLRRVAMDAARDLIDQSHAATSGAAGNAAALLNDCRRIVTHSFSSTVCAALTQLRGDVHVTFSESRPLYEGHRLAQALSRHGIRGTLITDAQLGGALRSADTVLIGADSILSDGALVNKSGTLPLAATAAHFGVAVYGCCETHKLRTADMPPIELEQMSPDELTASAWPGIEIRNVYFDITPPELLSGLITETGLTRFPGYRAGR